MHSPMINALKIDWGWYEVYCIYQLSCILPIIRPSLRGTPLFPQQFFYPSGSVIFIGQIETTLLGHVAKIKHK